jgi:hypothetical protein
MGNFCSRSRTPSQASSNESTDGKSPGPLLDDPVPRKASSHAASCIPPTLPIADLSRVVDTLLAPLGREEQQSLLTMLRDYVFGNRTMREQLFRLYYRSLEVTEDGIPEQALDELFAVQASRYGDITAIIQRRIDRNPVSDVNDGEQESVSGLTASAAGHGAVDHRGDNGGEVGPPANSAGTLNVARGANAQDGNNQGLNRSDIVPGHMDASLMMNKLLPPRMFGGAFGGLRDRARARAMTSSAARPLLHVMVILSDCAASTASRPRPRFISTLSQMRQQQVRVSCLFALRKEGGGGS